MKAKPRKRRTRNPVAKAAKKIPPKVLPDKRRKKLAALKEREAEKAMEEGGEWCR